MTTNGYSGLWNGSHGEQHSPLGNDVYKESVYGALSCLFGSGAGYNNAKVRELLLTLVGGDVGDAALVQRKRRKADANVLANVQGGLAVIETVDIINRVTTSADATRLTNALNQSVKPTYAIDPSGNSGGSKVGY